MRIPCLFSAFLLVALVYQNSFPNNRVEALVNLDAICRNTFYYNVCLETLKSDPRSPTSNVESLIQITIESGLKYAKGTLSQLQATIGETKNKDLLEILKVCRGNYVNLISKDLRNSLKELANRRLQEAHNSLVFASEDVNNCDDGFTGTTLVGSQLQNKIIHLEQLMTVGVQIFTSIG